MKLKENWFSPDLIYFGVSCAFITWLAMLFLDYYFNNSSISIEKAFYPTLLFPFTITNYILPIIVITFLLNAFPAIHKLMKNNLFGTLLIGITIFFFYYIFSILKDIFLLNFTNTTCDNLLACIFQSAFDSVFWLRLLFIILLFSLLYYSFKLIVYRLAIKKS